MFMRISSCLAALLLLVLSGCQREGVPAPTQKKADIKIDVPGVKVDIERGGTDGRKKVDVNVKVNP